MKAKKVSTLLLLSMFVLFTTASFAAEKASLRLTDPVTVNGKAVPVGEYTVTWEGTGPNVELKFLKGKDVVATSPAQVVNLTRATGSNSVATKGDANGTPALTQIMFSGKKYSLNLGDGAIQSADSSK